MYTGLPGTSPLPIHLAHLSGRPDATNTAAYTATNFTNQAFINRVSPLNPAPYGAIAALDATAFRNNALQTGLRRNFMVLNPRALGAVWVVQDKNGTKCNSMQMELRESCSGLAGCPPGAPRRWMPRRAETVDRRTPCSSFRRISPSRALQQADTSRRLG